MSPVTFCMKGGDSLLPSSVDVTVARSVKITDYWFNIAQLIYLVWNAINDPLFGYFQDNSKHRFLKHRRLNILYGAPIFALSFLLPWFSWKYTGSPDWVVGLHLTVSLCLYDGMFTFVLLAQCALFAEISLDQEDRQAVLKYSQVASIIGNSAIIFCEVFSDHLQKFTMFQLICIIIAFLSWFLMSYTGRNVKVAIERGAKDSELADVKGDAGHSSLLVLTRQIFSQRNFVCFVVMNFFQVFHTTFGGNFFGIFRDNLFGKDSFPSYLKTLLAGSAMILPQVVVLLSGPLIAKLGSYKVILWSFYMKVVAASFVYFVGLSHPWLLALFMVVDNTLPNAAFSLFNLSVSDIIDDDAVKFKRKNPLSSMVFGTNALVTKPAQSLAPMMVVYILGKHGYKANIKSGEGSTGETSQDLQKAMLSLLCFVPLVIGVIQIAVWKIYTLRK